MISEMETSKFNRLPKWAREHIEVLERRLAERDKHIILLQLPVEDDSRIIMDPHSTYKARTVADDTLIRYYLNAMDTIDIRLRDTDLELRATGGNIQMQIALPASNVIRVRTTR